MTPVSCLYTYEMCEITVWVASLQHSLTTEEELLGMGLSHTCGIYCSFVQSKLWSRTLSRREV